MAGYMYVDHEAPGHLQGAAVGARIRVPSLEPPWLVVDEELEGVLVVRWPGRLFRAEVVPPSTDRERAAAALAAGNLRSGAAFTRAVAVDLVEELSPALLFGGHGKAVLRVLEAGRALDGEGAHRLASLRSTTADQAYGAAWERWLADQPNGAPYRGRPHAWTLAVPGAGRSRSPIGHGFTVLSRVVRESARLRGGDEAFTVDEDGDEVTAPAWRAALGALLDAAMAFGAPDLVDAHGAAELTAAWRGTFERASDSPAPHAGRRAGGPTT
ncbi:hypothetical protein LG634_06490 [Streptomyces bambusae]|uniref:hypothetical protein n=1 Tax=Streptomyces bambusae TaxID=1550616 RepID=UPI001CFDF059|nr:hypothetical protein [Streptomyces bambusae]MCB5164483.1 hypothetical protein [Streptomyces bambusae]